MKGYADRRPLADLIVDLAAGLGAGRGGRLRPSGARFDLPVETEIELSSDGVLLRADMPRLRTRTAFDRPIGRLVLTIAADPEA
jgi:hypothetical protein